MRRAPDRVNEFINHQRRLKSVAKVYDADFNIVDPKTKVKETVYRPVCVRYDFSDRLRYPQNCILFCIYKIMRFVHVSIYFYSFPFIFLIAQYLVPVYYG